MNRYWIVAVLCVLGMACGSDSKPSPQQSAANSLSGSISSAIALSSLSGESAANAGTSTVSIVDSMAGNLSEFDTGMTSAAPDINGKLEVSQQVSKALAAAAAAPCYTVDTTTTPGTTTVKYTNCTATVDGITVTINGTVSGSATAADWEIHATAFGNVVVHTDNGNVTVHVVLNWDPSGHFTFTTTTIAGSATSAWTATGSTNTASFTFGWTNGAVIDLVYRPEPFCIGSGTVELTRTWTTKPAGVDLADVDLLFTWTGGSATACASSMTVTVM